MFFFFNLNPYIAIIGDIVKSKKIPNRTEVQKKLKNVLEEINCKYEKDISSKFMITLGDEFQGLLNCGTYTMDIINEIELKMYPIQLRYGIGIGEITTDINPNMPLGADGPAYYNARKMIDLLKNTEKRTKSIDSNIMIASDSENNDIDIMLNTILSLTTIIKEKWTQRQREVIALCLKIGDNQTKIAEMLNVNQSTVQRLLAKANYYTYNNALSTVSNALTEIKVNKDV